MSTKLWERGWGGITHFSEEYNINYVQTIFLLKIGIQSLQHQKSIPFFRKMDVATHKPLSYPYKVRYSKILELKYLDNEKITIPACL